MSGNVAQKTYKLGLLSVTLEKKLRSSDFLYITQFTSTQGPTKSEVQYLVIINLLEAPIELMLPLLSLLF